MTVKPDEPDNGITQATETGSQSLDLLGLGKAAEKMAPAALKIAEALQSIIGIASEPATLYLKARAEGAANRHEAKADAKALVEIDNLLAEKPELSARMKVRLLATEMRREQNISNGQKKALTIAQRSGASEPHDVDPDFIQEWIEGVKDVSSEEVQALWAELLAAAPNSSAGRVSKPAVDLLKQFDSSIAIMFRDLANYVRFVGWPSLKLGREIAPFGRKINFDILDDLGIIQAGTVSSTTIGGVLGVEQTAEFSGRLVPTLNVSAFRSRAIELASVIISEDNVSDEKLFELRLECLLAYADDPYWSLKITPLGRHDGEYLIPNLNIVVTDIERDEALNKISNDFSIAPNAKELILQVARLKRCRVVAQPSS